MSFTINLFAQKLAFNTELLSNVPFNENCSDIWGFTGGGIKYAIVGSRTKVSIFSLEDPQKPQLRYQAPGDASLWRDIKSYNNHVYVTADQGTGGVVIIDMTKAPLEISHLNFKPKLTLGTDINSELQRCHNLYIDEKGNMYLAGCNISKRGVLIFDLKPDPKLPVFAGSEDLYYSHDIFVRGDTLYSSELYEGRLGIYDIRNRSKPNLLASQPTSRSFTHNAWVSDDGKYVFTTDEKSGAYVEAYDITDLSNIRFLDKFRPIERENDGVIPHNTHYYNGFLITSWYTDGLRVIDAHKPDNLVEIAYFDTWEDQRICQSGFYGCWGAFPFTDSDIIYGSDINNGLFVVKVDYKRASYLEGKIISTNGSAIPNAIIEILSEQINNKLTGPSGEYKTGLAFSGSFKVRITHPDYESKEVTVQLINGEVTILNVMLKPRSLLNIDIDIKDKGGDYLVAKALFEGDGTQSSFQTTGNIGYKAGVMTGRYAIFISKWGYKNSTIHDFDLAMDSTLKLDRVLEVGYDDNFENDLGWSVINTSNVSGSWVRTYPRGTDSDTGQKANPDSDSDDEGRIAYVTGNGMPGAACDDVDNGSTELISPLMDLTNYLNPALNYDVWFYNNSEATSDNDTIIIELSNGQKEVVVDKIFGRTNGWLRIRNLEVNKFILPSSIMRLKVIASDPSSNQDHIVEAGFDHFFVSEMIISSSVSSTFENKVSVYPNPTTNEVHVRLDETDIKDSHFAVFDILGKKVTEGTIDFHTFVINSATWKQGVYFLVINDFKPVKIVRQ